MASFMSTDFYIIGTSNKIIDGVIVPVETVLTKPFRERSARYTLSKWKYALEMRNISLRKYGNGREYRAMLKEQSKRRNKARKLTIGEVAEIIGEVEKL